MNSLLRPPAPQPDPAGLAALGRQLQRELDLLGLPPANWPATVTGPDGAAVFDTVVIGAGMYGVAAAAALVLKGVRNILIVDKAPDGQEGPWITYARMRTLRSPKQLPGVALGLPSLTFRAWYEAGFGAAGWEALYKISNADWQSYLTWIRDNLALPLRSGTEVLTIDPVPGMLSLATSGGPILARRVVLASGRSGLGGGVIPPGVDRDLWPDLAAHTSEDIPFEHLSGRRIAVIGAGPSAWDNAATALEHGAGRVDMYVRRTELPQINKGRGSAMPGFFEGWASLPPAQKFRILCYLQDVRGPPPHESVLRAIRHDNFAIHLGTRVLSAVRQDGHVALDLAPGGPATADFLIAGTGFAADVARAPELAAFAPWIARWADRFTPPPGQEGRSTLRAPWLGQGFELTPNGPDAPPELSRIHLFNHAAYSSMGAIASDIPGVSVGAERLAHAIVAHLFAEDIDPIFTRLQAFAEPELIDTPFFRPDRFPPGSLAGLRPAPGKG